MKKQKVEFFRNNLLAADKAACMDVLDSIFLSTGDVVRNFETAFAGYMKSTYAIGVSTCTDALFLSLRRFDIRAGDEVITTPMSFIATANTVLYCGARPVFVDVERETGNIDHTRLEKAITRRTKAIIPVHLYGQMCDMRAIHAIAKKHNLKVIEDAAHCIEGMRDGIRVGALSDSACYSFYATKTITSGEGGAITCNTKTANEWFRKARLHGMSANAADRYTKRYHHYDMEFLGYKCNMINIQAALLLHQLDRVATLLKRREEIARAYTEGFSRNPHIRFPMVLPNSIHARYVYTIWVNSKKRDEYLRKIQDRGIGVAVNFRPIHLMSYYRKTFGYAPGDFPNAERIGGETITLPLYPRLRSDEIAYVIKTVNAIVTS